MKKKSTNTKTKRKDGGFSLIELLIVVAIILIIASIAIPNYLRAQQAAQQSGAVGTIRTLTTAQQEYAVTFGTGYATSMAALGGSATTCATGASAASACIIDPVLTNKLKSGYTFDTLGAGGAGTPVNPNATFEVIANPQVSSNPNSYCSDQTAVIRFQSASTAMTTAAGSCAAVANIVQ